MNAVNWLICCLLLNFLSLSNCSQISIDPDGGYKNIVVKIDKNVPEDQCTEILKNLKALLTDSSHLIHRALEGKAHFKSITIVIPSDWRDSKCQTIVRPPKLGTPYQNADILLSDVHSIYGAAPFTQQSNAQCGKPGDFLRIPYNFKRDAKLLVKEWAKLRYGIFDELGFAGDVQYPNYFKWNGFTLPTIATDVPLHGEWLNLKQKRCDPQSEDDCFYSLIGDNDQATCSLASLHHLPNVTRFCSAVDVPISGPTKQHVLCQGKSSLDIISSHADFVSSSKQIAPASIDPVFDIVRQPETQYVLMMETSSSMDHDKQWKWINKAAQKFIRYDLPVNSNLAIVTFSDKAKVEHQMVQVHSDQVRARLADTIPDKYHLSKSDRRCVLCAVQTVIEQVISDHKVGTHLILLTQGGPETLSAEDENQLQESVIKYNIKLNAIVMPGTSSHYSAFYDKITDQTHIVHYENNPLDFFVSLNRAFTQLLHKEAKYPTETPELVHLKSLTSGSSLSSGTFLIDSTLGRDTVFGIYVEDEEDHLIKAIQFTDSHGKNYGPFLRMSSDYDLINFKTINFPPGQAPPFSAPNQIGMTWKYTIEWHNLPNHGANPDPKSIVMVTSKSRSQSESHLINVKSWLSSEAIFVQVSYGDNALVGANVQVSANVELSKNGSKIFLSSMQLSDNGYGDPDLLSGDGIYTTYLTQFSHFSGRYTFDIQVTDNENRAFYVTKVQDHQNCCGSFIKVRDEDKKKIGTFSRSIMGPVYTHFSNATLLLRPTKIGDLQIRQLAKSDRLLATWTSPILGTPVSSYRFVFSQNIQDLLSEQNDPQVLLGFDRIDEMGTLVTFDFNFPHFNQDFYVGVYAFDMKDNRSPISNLVHINLKSFPESRTNKEILSEPKEKSDNDWVIIGSICGIISVLFLLAVSSISYYIYVSRQKFAAGNSAGSSVLGTTTTNSSDETCSFDSDLPKIVKNGPNTPMYWSASQLLNKIEGPSPSLYISELTNSHNPAPLWTYRVRDIPEEFTVTVNEIQPKPRNITQV